jgi:hypothetical protein
MATAGLIAGVAQTGLGIFQAISGSRKAKKAMQAFKENPYEIPQSIRRSTELAGTMAQGTKMAGQDIMEESLRSNTAEQVAQARQASNSPSQILSSTIDAYRAQQAQQQQLEMQASQDYNLRQQNYMQAVAQLAPYEDKQYQYNTLAPIQAQLNKASMMEQAGWGNIGAGISGATAVAANQGYLDSLGG